MSLISEVVLFAVMLVVSVTLLAAALAYLVHRQNNRLWPFDAFEEASCAYREESDRGAGGSADMRPFDRCNIDRPDVGAFHREPATVSRDNRSNTMLAISERANLVSTIDALIKLEEGAEPIVSLLGRLRSTHPKASWRILYAERMDAATDDADGPRTQLHHAQALVELTIGNLRRRNIGESTVGDNDDPLLTAVANALVPMIQVELADIAEAEDQALADRGRF